MREVSNGYKDLLNRAVQLRRKLWQISLFSGVKHYYIDGDEDILFDGKTWRALPGVEISAIRNSTKGEIQTASVKLPLSNNTISESAARYGEFDGASFYISQIHLDNLSSGEMELFSGIVTDLEFTETEANINLTGNAGRLATVGIGEYYSERCRNAFGDNRCLYPVDTISTPISIGTIASTQSFVPIGILNSSPGFYNFATIKFLTGANAGRVYDANLAGGNVVITTPVNYPLIVGDTAILRPGCSLFRKECVERWNNLKRFRGEPDVPNLTEGYDGSPQDNPDLAVYGVDPNTGLNSFTSSGTGYTDHERGGVWVPAPSYSHEDFIRDVR